MEKDVAIFGPWSRFRIEPVYHNGNISHYELFDVESSEPFVGRYTYATDAFSAASTKVPAPWRDRTKDGISFVPVPSNSSLY